MRSAIVVMLGVFVIDAEYFPDAEVIVERSGGRFSTATGTLTVGGRRRNDLVDAVRQQCEHVAEGLACAGHGDVPVTPVLCFVEGTFPKWVPAEGNVDIAGVLVRGLYGTTHLVVRDGRFDLPARRRLVQHLAHELPGH